MSTPDASAREIALDENTALADGFAHRMSELARRLGADARSVLWVERAAHALSRATAAGHVCMPLAALARREGASVAEVRDSLIASGVACRERRNAADLLPLVIDEDGRLYLARYFDYERRLAEALSERARNARRDVTANELAVQAARIERFFGPRKDDDIDWQRVAALAALSGRLTIVSGGPGTGKTTTVVGVLACLLDAAPDLRIALAAPTGKAAQRMQEALIERAHMLPPELSQRLPRTSFTLQRLLGVLPDGGFRHHRDNPLPYDVIVVDEASMIDVALAAHLLEAVAPTSRLVMLGDKDQLAAVEAGAVFAELSAQPAFSRAGAVAIATGLGVKLDAFDAALPDAGRVESPLTDCVIWLTRNYRFGLDSDIGRLSIAIRDGDASGALAALHVTDPNGEHAAILHDDDQPKLPERVLARLAAGFAPYTEALSMLIDQARHGTPAEQPIEATLFDALNAFRVLCATRNGARGVDEVNARIAMKVRERAGIAVAMGAQWFAGRPVIVTRNDYALGLFNGDIGIALPGVDGALRVAFRMADGTLRYVSPAALPPHETAFALTVHKSQGSEFEHAALVLPSTFARVLSRELVYTAITRAKRRVDVFGAAEIFAQAVAAPTRRDSGLAARMRRLA